MKSDLNLTDSCLIDSHAHLELQPLSENPAKYLERARAKGIAAVVSVGIDEEDAARNLAIAEAHEQVFACLGFHPHNASEVSDNGLARMEELALHPKVVGYGEIGLDFFRNLSPPDKQRIAFRAQIALAKRLGLPLIIHLRDAYPEGLSILESAAPYERGGVVHCFSGTSEDAERVMNLGFYISIPGTVTYKKNEALRKIVAEIPEDRILVETDCPYLSPEPFRGRDNEPAHVLYTAKKVGDILGMSLRRVADITTANTCALFGLSRERYEESGITRFKIRRSDRTPSRN